MRAALLDAIVALVRERGIEGLSLREVSRRAGVSHTAAYNHFADKSALVAAVVRSSFERFADALEAAREGAPDTIEALMRVGIAYVVFAHANPQEFKIMFRPELTQTAVAEEDAKAMRAYKVLVESVDAALAAGTIAGDPETIVRASWSIVHGLAALIVDGPGASIPRTHVEVERVARETIGVLVDGTRARS